MEDPTGGYSADRVSSVADLLGDGDRLSGSLKEFPFGGWRVLEECLGEWGVCRSPDCPEIGADLV